MGPLSDGFVDPKNSLVPNTHYCNTVKYPSEKLKKNMVNCRFSPMKTNSSPLENTNFPMKMKILRQIPSEKSCCYYYPWLELTKTSYIFDVSKTSALHLKHVLLKLEVNLICSFHFKACFLLSEEILSFTKIC